MHIYCISSLVTCIVIVHSCSHIALSTQSHLMCLSDVDSQHLSVDLQNYHRWQTVIHFNKTGSFGHIVRPAEVEKKFTIVI